MIYRLIEDIIFPDPHLAEDNGLLAIGGDLSTERLVLAYSYGIFPWYSFKYDNEILWYCPKDRFVIFPQEIHISHSMRNLINKGTYHVTKNKNFDGVIENCSSLRINLDGAWLGKDMIKAYKRLHKQGFASSFEVWQDTKLVGGLYGVSIGNTFCGESMFSIAPSASKLALITLATTMQQNGGKMIDCQFETNHLLTMGGRHISYDEYMKIRNSDEK